MKSVLLCLLLSLSIVAFSQSPTTPVDSSRTTFTIFLKDGGQYVGRIVARDSSKVVIRRQGGGLSYLAPADITRIERYQSKIRMQGREQYTVTLTDGTVYTGQIEKQDSVMVLLRRRGGKSVLSTKEIARIEPVSKATMEEDAPLAVSTMPTASTIIQDNQFPWLLGNQTAIPLKAGRLTYRNIWFLYNELSYGLFGFITLRTSIIPSFGGETFYNNTLYTRPSIGGKLSIPIGSVHIGGDLNYRWTERSLYYGDRRNVNQRIQTLTGFVTFGSTKGNLTLGYTNQKSTSRVLNRKSIDIGFVAPLGRRLSLVSDNRILVGEGSYYYNQFSQISGVLRLNRPRHAFDLGVMTAIVDEDRLRFYPLLYVAYSMRLSQK